MSDWRARLLRYAWLAGISFHRFLERLVGGDPEILAEGVVVAIDATVPDGR